MLLCGYCSFEFADLVSLLTCVMQVNMEQTILSQYRRLPGFHSEFLGLEVMDMSNERIGFEDFLNGEVAPFVFALLSKLICFLQTLVSVWNHLLICTLEWSVYWE